MSLSRRLLLLLRANLSALIADEKETTLDDALPDEEERFARRRARAQAPSGPPRSRSARHLDPRLIEHYRTLKVPVGADLATVKQSFRRLLREVHPDLQERPGPEAEERARVLILAYTELCRYLSA
jgi:DnaJ-domain-containing protein 1